LGFGVLMCGNTAFLSKMRCLQLKNGDFTWFLMSFVIHSPLTIGLPGGCSKNGYVGFRPTNNEVLIFRARPKKHLYMERWEDGEVKRRLVSRGCGNGLEANIKGRMKWFQPGPWYGVFLYGVVLYELLHEYYFTSIIWRVCVKSPAVKR